MVAILEPYLQPLSALAFDAAGLAVLQRDTDRSLVLRHLRSRGRPLAAEDAEQVMKHLARLWGFRVRLEETEPDGTVSSYREQDPPNA